MVGCLRACSGMPGRNRNFWFGRLIGDNLLGWLAAFCVVFGASVPVEAEHFVLDRSHTEVRFSWDHLGMSRQSGEIRDVVGRVWYDPDQPAASNIRVSMGVSSLATGVADLDRQLTQTTDYFDAAQYPAIEFVSTSFEMLSGKTAQISGELTINGISKPVTLSAVLNFYGEHVLAKINPSYVGVKTLGISARAKILRSEWGMTRAIPYVSDEIEITIEAELHRAR